MKRHPRDASGRISPLETKEKESPARHALSEVHDIFLRAYVIAANKTKKRKRKGKPNLDTSAKWPKHALIIDTETRITSDQSLTFGVYRFCTLVGDTYTLTEEGVFYADDLPSTELNVLTTQIRSAIPDVASFPPRFPLYSRFEFMKKVFWPAIKRDGALICGLNLPFDLARLALDWGRGDKDEWSLTIVAVCKRNREPKLSSRSYHADRQQESIHPTCKAVEARRMERQGQRAFP